jgi:hypothetical protein
MQMDPSAPPCHTSSGGGHDGYADWHLCPFLTLCSRLRPSGIHGDLDAISAALSCIIPWVTSQQRVWRCLYRSRSHRHSQVLTRCVKSTGSNLNGPRADLPPAWVSEYLMGRVPLPSSSTHPRLGGTALVGRWWRRCSGNDGEMRDG